MSGTNTPARGASKVEGLVTLKSPEEQGVKLSSFRHPIDHSDQIVLLLVGNELYNII